VDSVLIAIYFLKHCAGIFHLKILSYKILALCTHESSALGLVCGLDNWGIRLDISIFPTMFGPYPSSVALIARTFSPGVKQSGM
jgi:hypothetical protein